MKTKLANFLRNLSSDIEELANEVESEEITVKDAVSKLFGDIVDKHGLIEGLEHNDIQDVRLWTK